MKMSMLSGSLLFVFIFMLQPLWGQADLSVVGSCGDRLQGNNLTLDWTVGEPVVSTVSTSSSLLSQGFHQPSVDTMVVTALSGTLSSLISVAPNPSSGMVVLKVADWPDAHLKVLISDTRGTVLKRLDNVGQGNTEIDLTPFSAGIYNVSVCDAAGNIHQRYSIIKCD